MEQLGGAASGREYADRDTGGGDQHRQDDGAVVIVGPVDSCGKVETGKILAHLLDDLRQFIFGDDKQNFLGIPQDYADTAVRVITLMRPLVAGCQ